MRGTGGIKKRTKFPPLCLNDASDPTDLRRCLRHVGPGLRRSPCREEGIREVDGEGDGGGKEEEGGRMERRAGKGKDLRRGGASGEGRGGERREWKSRGKGKRRGRKKTFGGLTGAECCL